MKILLAIRFAYRAEYFVGHRAAHDHLVAVVVPVRQAHEVDLALELRVRVGREPELLRVLFSIVLLFVLLAARCFVHLCAECRCLMLVGIAELRLERVLLVAGAADLQRLRLCEVFARLLLLLFCWMDVGVVGLVVEHGRAWLVGAELLINAARQRTLDAVVCVN